MPPVLLPPLFLTELESPGLLGLFFLPRPDLSLQLSLFLLELQGLLGLGADPGGPGLPLDLSLPALGIADGLRGKTARHGGAEPQLPPVLQQELIHFLVPWFSSEDDAAHLVPPVLLPLIQANPEGVLK